MAEELRQRQVVPKSAESSEAEPAAKRGGGRARRSDSGGISVADILRVLVTLVVASCGLSYYVTSSESVLWGYRPWFTRWPVLVRYLSGPLNLTPTQLALYNGSDPTLPILLAVNGSIFDVSANPLIYGPGGSYNFFAGRDATRAFVTGCFQEDLTPDLTGVEEMFVPVDDPESEEELKLTSRERKIRREQETRMARAQVRRQVAHWENFFRNHKRYFEVGKVVGEEEGEKKTKRDLCEAARLQRPVRGKKNNQRKPGN